MTAGSKHESEDASSGDAPLSLADSLRSKCLFVVGGTGFLGKVWLAMLLGRFPEIGHVYLVVRERDGLLAEERFWRKVMTTEVFSELRRMHGDGFEQFVRGKVTPVGGDITLPLVGLDPALQRELSGRVDAVVNVAGVVDFDPPLDEALEVNAFGCQNLVALARELGGVPVLHTSTCFTAGSRTGPIEEADPREIPFPRAGQLDPTKWSPEREIAECLDVIEQARHRASDAFRQSHFLDEAKTELARRGEPDYGAVLDDELARVRRRYVERQLAGLGMERAQFWGFPNTYTYTKAIGEQIVASSGLPNTIVRPAIVETTMEYPFPGWNEGINTSSPIIFLIREGGLQVPGSKNNLDLIPCDMVVGAILLALAELLRGEQAPVYQAASSDTNPASMARFFELSGLHKRRFYKETGRGGPLLSALAARFESSLLSRKEYEAFGPHRLAQVANTTKSLLDRLPGGNEGTLGSVLSPAKKGLYDFARQQQKLARVMDTFLPFIADYQYVFSTANVRRAYARLSDDERALVPWYPERIDWRSWFLDIHVPALERHVFPEMERRLKRQAPPPRAHESLTSLLDAAARRFDLSVALARTEQEGLSRVSFRALHDAARRFALALCEAGVRPGDRVLLGGKNHPAWAASLFAIHYAGATAVPVDSSIGADALRVIKDASRAKVAVFDDALAARGSLDGVPTLSLLDSLAHASIDSGGGSDAGEFDGLPGARGSDVALLIYTSGTTGRPKGVMLSHANLTSLVASLAPLFPLDEGDRLLSVLPLHHTFELTCGLLLPLSRGSRVVYLDEVSVERLSDGLTESRATALVGVPALFESIERRVLRQIDERGPLATKGFEVALEVSRAVGKSTGLDVGRLLFGPVHQALGGQLRFLVSGGAALGGDTHSLFQGLGLHLAEGYGLTESSPVLTVAAAGPRSRAGHVGKAVPGVEVRIAEPNPDGVGEVLARGPNVMLGYADDPEATALAIDGDGWLHTGDLGKLDRRGQLVLVGRKKDVVVTKTGENIYPDDVEARLGHVASVRELAVLGVADGRGGERLALAAVVDSPADATNRASVHHEARLRLDERIRSLPPGERPGVVVLFDEALPRTSTRKVKRGELRKLVEQELLSRSGDAGENARPGALSRSLHGGRAEVLALVQRHVAALSRRKPDDVLPVLSLRGDLGFDSLMALELLVALERELGRSLDAERLAEAATVEELVAFLGGGGAPSSGRTERIEQGEGALARLTVPEPLREAAMAWLARGQDGFYSRVMRSKVTGQAFIPHNRPTVVVANHASHLDMGLVKYALGSYGENLVTLAARDYFFEGQKRAFFEQFSRLEPIDRGGSLRASLRRAGELLDRGTTLLVFPEGTRSTDGAMQRFKPLIGHLALEHRVDILPLWLGGTFEALPRGAKFVTSRSLEARIGPALEVALLERLTGGLGGSDRARVATRIAEESVRALARGTYLDLESLDIDSIRRTELPPPPGVEGVIDELKLRFVKGAVGSPVSYYLSIGEERWTVRATPTELEVARGKTVEQADCVLKTTPGHFERIVREAWVPGPSDFMSGSIKTNNVAHLLSMQKLFQLSVPTERLFANSSFAESPGGAE